MASNGVKCDDRDMQRLFSYIDSNRERFIGDLDEAIRIKSVSASPDCRKVGEQLNGYTQYGL